MSDPQDEKKLVEALLSDARLSIERGETELKRGVEKMAEAERLGASHRDIAKAVGKSASWVNRMLKWRERDYRDNTPFGPQSKEARRRKARVEATKQAEEEAGGSTADERLRAIPIWTRDTEKEAAERLQVASASHSPSDVQYSCQPEQGKTITRRRPGMSQERRRLLLDALVGLSASDAVDRANAASWVEKHRSAINLSWDELIVPADAPERQIWLLSDQSAGKAEQAAHG